MTQTHKIKFATKFPEHHPKAGKETFFVEQILSDLIKNQKASTELLKQSFVNIYGLFNEKKHTIRKGNAFQKGDYFFPTIEKDGEEIAFADRILIENVWDFSIKKYETGFQQTKFFIEFGKYFVHEDMDLNLSALSRLAKNDGFPHLADFVAWFKFPKQEFQGQIICWDKDLKY